MSHEPLLLGRVALVTGASRGLGRAIAEALWREGASLWMVARSAAGLDELASALAPRALADQRVETLAADLADPAAPRHIAEQVVARFGRVDVLVNNAALIGPIGRLWESDEQAWDETLRVDLLAPVALCRAVVPGMIARGAGRIVNVSGGGASTPLPHFSAYATAKAALVRFSETLGRELDGSGVEVNCLGPGALDTDMHARIREAGPERAGADMHGLALEVARTGGASMERAAALCVFLASSRSRGISGRLLSAVWDPWTQLEHRVEELAASDVYTLRRIVPADRGKDWNPT